MKPNNNIHIYAIIGIIVLVSASSCRQDARPDLDIMKLSGFHEFSISYRTAYSYDGILDGCYYVVKTNHEKDGIEMDCRMFPPKDSSEFRNLSEKEKIKDMIRRRVPLDKREREIIKSGIRILKRYDIESLHIKKNQHQGIQTDR